MLSTVSCEWESGDTPSGKKLGYQLWSIAHEDLTRVNEIFDFVAYYNMLQTIDDEQQRKEFINRYFNGAYINIEGNVHMIVHNTSYGSNYYTIIEMCSDHWRIRRSGGYGYDMTITPTTDDTYRVELSDFYNLESKGYGSFIGTLYYVDNIPVIGYTGTLTMVDGEESISKPLTITTEITDTLSYTYPYAFSRGTMTITAHDAIYNTTDKAKVSILHNTNNQIVIECYGNVTGYRIW
jgi:hypothetical protein